MPRQVLSAAGLSADVIEFIRLLCRFKVRYLIVGGEAVIFHGYPRLTGDVDFFYERTRANATRLFKTLEVLDSVTLRRQYEDRCGRQEHRVAALLDASFQRVLDHVITHGESYARK